MDGANGVDSIPSLDVCRPVGYIRVVVAPHSLPLKAVSVELQRPAILRDCSHNLVGGSLGKVGRDSSLTVTSAPIWPTRWKSLPRRSGRRRDRHGWDPASRSQRSAEPPAPAQSGTRWPFRGGPSTVPAPPPASVGLPALEDRVWAPQNRVAGRRSRVSRGVRCCPRWASRRMPKNRTCTLPHQFDFRIWTPSS